jgi:hypothetical protein
MKILKDRSSHLENRMAIEQNKAASKNNMILALTLIGIIGIIFGVWVMLYNFTYSMIIMFLSMVSMQFAWAKIKNHRGPLMFQGRESQGKS